MHSICKAAVIVPFFVYSFASAQQNTVTSETVATPDVTGTTMSSVPGIPKLVRFSGTLKQKSTSVPILFSLYQEQEGGTALWQEAQTVQVDAQGKFTVLLGSTRKDGLPLDVFMNGKAHWLGVQIQPGQGASTDLQQPTETSEQRVLLVGVPYALKAGDADTLGGKPASAFLQAPVASKGKASANAVAGNTTSANANPSATANATVAGSGSTNYVPIWLSSSTLGNSLLYQTGGNVAIGTTSPVSKFEVAASSPAITLEGYNTAATGSTFGIAGIAASTTGIGVAGRETATSGATIGVRGETSSISGTGVFGLSTATTGNTAGVVGEVQSKLGVAGIFNNTASSGKVLSGRSNGSETFFVDNKGDITSYGNLNLNPTNSLSGGSISSGTVTAQGFPAISAYSDSGDTIVASTRDAIAVHAYGGQSYSTAALEGDGGQVPGLIATSSDSCEVGPPCTIVLAQNSSNTSEYCVINSFGDLTCTGTKSAAVDVAGRHRALYAVESPENWFEDFGSAKLSLGVETVKIDSVFGQTINSTMDYHVFLTPNGDCKGLYVSKKTPTSFEVRELGGGQSSVSFDYRIVARRKGYESVRMADVTLKLKPHVSKPPRKIVHLASSVGLQQPR